MQIIVRTQRLLLNKFLYYLKIYNKINNKIKPKKNSKTVQNQSRSLIWMFKKIFQ